ncbi:DUF3883 domain-containing protein [Inconstantimicrobium mannanitabidum]|uniref:Uncharacterized protein n=1 Tax=Inconstantimicrobium mannanitabidum TaxID=1604901 RepID=A0ACB5R780_9CLOT|nr:DUF3883 domain-containing protein [Clostridium sp. TW13]GKX64856.1 hypothetical protein rsdtw13_01140 [Clostridium sp. TW13]
MLQELKRYNDFGNINDIMYFFREIISNRQITKKDIQVLASNLPGKIIDTEALLLFGVAFGIVQYSYETEKYVLVNEYQNIINMPELFQKNMFTNVMNELFSKEYLTNQYFEFDNSRQRIRFKNEIFPLNKSSYRNLLVSIGFIEIEKNDKMVHFFVTKNNEQIVEERLKEYRKKMTLLQLKKNLVEKEMAGEKAEKFVLEYEKRRLKDSKICDCIRQISHIDVSAGYDIVSFETINSTEVDRYIEVKAVKSDFQFYWSINEYNSSKIKGNKYCLYLIELSKIENVDYEPYIIENPYEFFEENSDWLIQTQTFSLKKIL